MTDDTTTEDTTETEMPEETTEETAKPMDLLSLIKDMPDAPTQSTIDGWKVKYGNVFVSGFSETEVYIWRALNRSEYKKMQIAQQIEATLGQLSEKPTEEEVTKKVTAAAEAEFAREEQTVAQCLLWPKLTTEELSMKAGTVSSILEQITMNSNFLTPQQASMLVIKL